MPFSSIQTVIMVTWVAVSSLIWCVVAARAVWVLWRLPRLPKDISTDEPWPRVSIIVPARNEAQALPAAVETLLAQDYPDFEIILVDDRSDDDTASIIDRVAASDPRVRAVHVNRLPDAWLGKVHAMHVGTKQAQGEWLLFTDADIHFHPSTLRRTIALCSRERLDHLTLGPYFRELSFMQTVLLSGFSVLFMAFVPIPTIRNRRTDGCVGVGAFNLVRRSVFDRSEGFPWLRMELVDDMGLALLMRRAGAKAAYALGQDAVAVTWYPSFSAMTRGLEKMLVPMVCSQTISRLLATTGTAGLLVATPMLAWLLPLPGLWPWMALAGGSLLVLVFSLHVRFRQGSLLALPLLPFGQLLLVWIMLGTGLRTRRSAMVEWRGTTYGLDAILRGQRIRPPRDIS